MRIYSKPLSLCTFKYALANMKNSKTLTIYLGLTHLMSLNNSETALLMTDEFGQFMSNTKKGDASGLFIR